MIHAIVDVSAPEEEVMVNEVPATRAETYRNPGVPPLDWLVKKIRDDAATAVVDTVTEPAISVAVPILALLPSLIYSPEPAVVMAILPDEENCVSR